MSGASGRIDDAAAGVSSGLAIATIERVLG